MTDKPITIEQVQQAYRDAQNAYRRYRRSLGNVEKQKEWKQAEAACEKLLALYGRQKSGGPR